MIHCLAIDYLFVCICIYPLLGLITHFYWYHYILPVESCSIILCNFTSSLMSFRLCFVVNTTVNPASGGKNTWKASWIKLSCVKFLVSSYPTTIKPFHKSIFVFLIIIHGGVWEKDIVRFSSTPTCLLAFKCRQCMPKNCHASNECNSWRDRVMVTIMNMKIMMQSLINGTFI